MSLKDKSNEQLEKRVTRSQNKKQADAENKSNEADELANEQPTGKNMKATRHGKSKIYIIDETVDVVVSKKIKKDVQVEEVAQLRFNEKNINKDIDDQEGDSESLIENVEKEEPTSIVFRIFLNSQSQIISMRFNIFQVETIQFTGQVPIDKEALNTLNSQYQVYINENNEPYDCMLNQTNLSQNNNKYYLLQLLKHKHKHEYVVWFRWGRVGKSGQTSCQKYGSDLDKAKEIFEQKFLDKTSHYWSERNQFEKVPTKYDIVYRDYKMNDESEEKKLRDTMEEANKPIPASKLDERVQSLIEFICNIQEMENIVREMKYDAKKAPLGKLNATQLKAGYQALRKIEDFIKANKFGKDFYEACNTFYTRIPHDFGMRVPTPINTLQLLKEKLTLLEALDDIEIAFKVLNSTSTIENPIDRQYEQLDCIIRPLDRENGKMFKMIENYLHKTHAPTHCTYKMKLRDVFEIENKMEIARFKDVGNRMLLWHGSRTTNWFGILSKGLRVAPPEAPMTGYMFGKGCYFADSSSKSANYCFTNKNKNTGILSLSEVSLGTPNELIHADHNADKLPKSKQSCKGVGKFTTDKKEWVILDDGCIIPSGKLIPNVAQNTQAYSLMYNEYIVYDTCQIKTRYLCRIEFDFV